MYNEGSSMSDNTGFYTFLELLILVLYKTYHPQKSLTSWILNAIVSIREGLIQLHKSTTQHV